MLVDPVVVEDTTVVVTDVVVTPVVVVPPERVVVVAPVVATGAMVVEVMVVDVAADRYAATLVGGGWKSTSSRSAVASPMYVRQMSAGHDPPVTVSGVVGGTIGVCSWG